MKAELLTGLAVGPVLLAAAAATYVELRARPKRGRRLVEIAWRFAAYYAVPGMVLGAFAAYCFSTLILIPYFPGSPSVCHRHDKACLARVDPELNRLASLAGLAGSDLLAVGYIAVVAWRRSQTQKPAVRADGALPRS
jgi:hypothetical protein